MGIRLENVKVAFGEKVIYENLNLEIEKNEFVCILGKSGSGKTILLNTMMGSIHPVEGEVFINEKLVSRPSKLTGVVYQDFFILPWLTIRQNIALGASKKQNIELYADLLKITKYLDLYPKQVSIGTKQRTSIARALSSDSDILLMDEPLCSVDAITAQHIRIELKRLTKEKTVVYVTHDVNEALQLASRIICISPSGKIILDKNNIDSGVINSDIIERLEQHV